MNIPKLFKTSDEDKAYHAFMLKYELYSLRIACYLGSIYTLVFLIVDYWRATHYQYVFGFRLAMIIILLVTAWRAIHVKSDRGYVTGAIAISGLVVILSFVMDRLAGMPEFFLPNFICLLVYVFNAGLGHPLWIKSLITLSFLTGFTIYGMQYSPHRQFHLSQGWNIMVNSAISMVIGYLIERYKRLNFSQRSELLSARKKIEKLDNLKTRLISIMSHDLVTPISNLRGLLALKDQNILSAEETSQYYAEVGRSLDATLFMLQNLLKWSRTLLEGEKINTVPVNVKNATSDVIEFLHNQSGPKLVTVQNKITDGIIVDTNPEVLKIILRNLLSNSIKYSHPNSVVTIVSAKDNGLLSLTVLDHGLGMTQDDIQNLFTLKKNSKKGTGNEVGTGIGLVLTKEFSDMLGMSITAESEHGKGSRFTIRFPESTKITTLE